MYHSDLLPFDELWPRVAKRVQPLNIETLSLLFAVKRILRADATAFWDLPMADNSAMDGFAVRASDTNSAPNCVLQILDRDAYAGTESPPRIEPGTAIVIGTGGLLPPGADAIAIKEIVDRTKKSLTVREPVQVGAHIRRAGQELRAGDRVVPAGVRLTPAHIAAAAAAGITEVTVATTPRVTVMSTGNELVPIGCKARPGQVVNTNTPLLAMHIEDLLGVQPNTLDHAVDDRDVLRATLSAALEATDLLVLSGGVSVGDRDLVKPVLEEDLGVERCVWRVAQKPGKPTYIGQRGDAWVIGLPGNPAAVATGWFTLVKPLVLALMGAADPAPPRLPARLANVVRPNHSRTHLRWCTSTWRDGERWIEALGRSGSHMLSDLAQADMLAIIPPGSDEVAAGTPLQAIPI